MEHCDADVVHWRAPVWVWGQERRREERRGEERRGEERTGEERRGEERRREKRKVKSVGST
jgi:hypothetical protein